VKWSVLEAFRTPASVEVHKLVFSAVQEKILAEAQKLVAEARQ
jgi:hypothetical protein